MKKIINCETGEEVEVELTSKDAKQQEIDEEAQRALETEKATKEAARQQVMEKLGLSADEVAALLA